MHIYGYSIPADFDFDRDRQTRGLPDGIGILRRSPCALVALDPLQGSKDREGAVGATRSPWDAVPVRPSGNREVLSFDDFTLLHRLYGHLPLGAEAERRLV